MDYNFNQQPAMFPVPQMPKSTSGMGIAALVLGIVALIISWVPIVNYLAFVIALVGLILGAIAIYNTRPSGEKVGRGLSIAGTVLSILALLIVICTQYIYSKALEEVGKAINGEKPAAVATKEAPAKDSGKKSETGLIAGKYLIENIEVKKIGVDYEGKPTVVVSYEMTNKSDERSNMFDLDVKVFQNKVSLETAMYMDSPSGYDNESQFKEILPGGKKTVTEGFVLSNEKDPVIVEIAPTVDFNDDSPRITKEFSLQ